MKKDIKRVEGIRNIWYVAAHSGELKNQVLGRILLGTAIVLYRKTNGQVVALRDACGHRFAPLSMGRIVNDNIECPYHGAVYDEKGKCIEFSGTDNIPKRCSITSFPVVERDGFIWLWFGSAAADTGLVPDIFGQSEIMKWNCLDGQFISLQANYSLLVDNLLDSSHAKYVHATTLAAPGMLAQRGDESVAKFNANIGETDITYTVDIKNGDAGKVFHEGLGKRMGMDRYRDPVDWHLDVKWSMPSFFAFDNVCKPAGSGMSESVQVCNFHAITPETETSCHYFYRTIERIDEGHNPLCRFWHDIASLAFTEDKRIIEAQQNVIGQSKPFDSDTWGVFQSDDLGMHARRIIRNARQSA